jgi:rhodanese-related sulfurtransferase
MKTTLIITVGLIITCFSASAHIPDSTKYQSLDPYHFHLQYLKENPALLIDVREYFEFKGNRIKGAINIPSSGNFDFAADTLDKNIALFLYCSTGFRSKRVAEHLYEKGFRKLYSLYGGIVAWKKDGYPVEKRKIRNHNHR